MRLDKVDMNFEDWKAEANKICGNITGGIALDDLPDKPYYDWFESGLSPLQAVNRVLESEGFPLGGD